MENEATSITPEKYPTMFESLSEIQKSHPNAEMPVIFVKPEVIIDKLNNLLESMKFNKDQNLMQNKAIVTNVANRVQTQNSNNVQSKNIVEKNDVNRLLATLLSENLVRDEKFMKSSVPEKFSSLGYIDEDISTDKNKKLLRYVQFLEKLRNISKMKATNDLKKEDRIDYIKDIDRLTSQENYALDASNKLESSEFVVTAISNPDNFVDHTIRGVDLINTLQDLKQKFSDLIKAATQDNNSENNSSFDENDERVNAHLEPYLAICPPYESHEFSDISVKESSKDSLEKSLKKDSQSISAQQISEQIENGSSDIDERNQDKQDIDDNDMLISSSSDASVSRTQDRLFDISTIVPNIEEQHLSKNIANIKEDEKYDSTEIENLYKLWFLQPTVQDNVEFSTPNVDDFQWFNMPPRVADLRWGDISKSSEMQSSLLWDTDEDMNVDDVIPESQCEITIKMGILKVKCPTIKFDEEWNFTSPKIPIADVPKVTNFEDILNVYHTECKEDTSEQLEVQNISNENFDKEVTMSQDSVLKIIDGISLEESTTSAKISNNALFDSYVSTYRDSPFYSGEINQDYYDYTDFLFDNSNEEEVKQTTVSSSISEFSSSTIDSNKERNPFFDISDAQQPEQLKISKEQDYSVSDNTETFLKDLEHFYALEKKLTSLFKNEVSNIITQYLSKNSYENYRHNICNIFRYMRSLSQHPWGEQYVALRQFLEYIQNLDYSHNIDDDYHRKKRMTDDLTWQQGMSSITYNLRNRFVNVLLTIYYSSNCFEISCSLINFLLSLETVVTLQ